MSLSPSCLLINPLSEGGTLTQTFEYEKVGITLQVRPNITPYVIDDPSKMPPEAIEELEHPKEKLESIRELLETVIEKDG